MSPILNNDMKTYIRHITLTASALLAALVLAASCARDERDLLPADMIPLADLELSWQVEDPAVYTKAGQSVYTENRVVNLYVLLFNGERLVRRVSYYVGTGTKPDEYDVAITSFSERGNENAAATRGVIPYFFDNNLSGKDPLTTNDLQGSLTFYAVANYTEGLENQLAFDDLTKSQMDAMTLEYKTGGNVGRSNFVMIAHKENVQLNVTEGQNGLQVERVGVNLDLRRIDAKVMFQVSFEIDEAIDAVSFSNAQIRVFNIPNASYLFEQSRPDNVGIGTENNWDLAAQSNNFSYMQEGHPFDSSYADRPGGEYSFYLMENRPLPEKMISKDIQGTYPNLYAMREAWEKDGSLDEDINGKTPVEGRHFIYAPQNGTYVSITGHLLYHRNGQDGIEEVAADVTYIVHLGETGRDPNNEESVNNYDVRRNVRYIYNVRIVGIENLIVEVREQRDDRPGAEGDVSLSSSGKKVFDAHYGRVLLELDRENLKDASWSVRSPFGGHIYYDPETGLINSPYDYKWVLFAINKHFPTNNGMGTVGNDEMVKFPGIDAYDGGVRFYEGYNNPKSIEEIKASIAEDYGNNFEDNRKFKDRIQGTDNYYSQLSGRYNRLDEDACLRDINQLINYLKKEALDENSDLFEDGKVYVTAFCDEFTYIYDPRYEDYVHPGTSVGNMGDKERRLALWKEYVNIDNSRVMNLTPMQDTDRSPDGNTSVTNAYISIFQNSIKTIYDPDNIETAWGLETVNETDELPYGITQGLSHWPIGHRSNTFSNGRQNFMNFFVGDNNSASIEWTDVMTVDQEVENAEGLHPEYRDPFHACITRNRDINGNNKIDEDEIIWYLAARDQLNGLWIGQPSLNPDEWMYQSEQMNNAGSKKDAMRHFVTSSYVSGRSFDAYNRNNISILWAEEGGSVGRIGEWEDDMKDGDGKILYDYRCIRNLGIDIADQNTPPAHYAKVLGEGNYRGEDYYIIDMQRLETESYRSESEYDGGGNSPRIPLDNERGINNRPYKSFMAMKNYTSSIITWANMINSIENNENPCPQGWRAPNQREMLIMMSTLNPDNSEKPVDDVVWLINGQNFAFGIATKFSFNGRTYYPKRPGFVMSSGDGKYNLMLLDGSGGESVHLRCVRDVN